MQILSLEHNKNQRKKNIFALCTFIKCWDAMWQIVCIIVGEDVYAWCVGVWRDSNTVKTDIYFSRVIMASNLSVRATKSLNTFINISQVCGECFEKWKFSIDVRKKLLCSSWTVVRTCYVLENHLQYARIIELLAKTQIWIDTQRKNCIFVQECLQNYSVFIIWKGLCFVCSNTNKRPMQNNDKMCNIFFPLCFSSAKKKDY